MFPSLGENIGKDEVVHSPRKSPTPVSAAGPIQKHKPALVENPI